MTIGGLHHVGRSTTNVIFNKTIAAIWDALSNDYIKLPRNANEWRIVANEFHHRWQFRCLGAIDGKHVMIKVV